MDRKNLYNYLMAEKGMTAEKAIAIAKKAYDRFVENGRTLVPARTCDQFAFMVSENGYQAFTFRRDQVVTAGGELGIVTGWFEAGDWCVRVKTARGEFHYRAEGLTPAAFPEGLVEILRGKVHDKVDEAFA